LPSLFLHPLSYSLSLSLSLSLLLSLSRSLSGAALRNTRVCVGKGSTHVRILNLNREQGGRDRINEVYCKEKQFRSHINTMQQADGKGFDSGLMPDANGKEPSPGGQREDRGKWQKPRITRKSLMKCCLVKWIIDSTTNPQGPESSDVELELSTVRYQPEGLDQLQIQTKFTRKELQSLYRGFKNECPSGLVDEETFKTIYSQFFPQGGRSLPTSVANEAVGNGWETAISLLLGFEVLFNAFDMDRNGAIRFEDFVIGLSVLLRGSDTEKLRWAFNLYDINKDGYITKEEMLAIMTSIYDMMGRYTCPSVRDDDPSEHVEKFFQKMDRNRDGVVTIDEFIETCKKDENIMASMQLFENVI
ncbi:hypothetical protein UPYG_G00283480, partial [Umbra pygmaea]